MITGVGELAPMPTPSFSKEGAIGEFGTPSTWNPTTW